MNDNHYCLRCFITGFCMDTPTSLPSQRQLIQTMYLDHHDWLQQWLGHRVSYPVSAADLVQDTFIKLLQSKQHLLDIQEPRAFLVHISKHILIDKQRRYYVEKNYLANLQQQLEHDAVTLSDQDIADAIDLLDFLSLALQDTSIAVRQAFVMYYFEGYHQSEIAKAINKSLRTVQGYLAQCLHLCFQAKPHYYGMNYGAGYES